MLPEIPREVVVHPGPVASVHLEASRDRGGTPHEVRLRWEALATQLCERCYAPSSAPAPIWC